MCIQLSVVPDHDEYNSDDSQHRSNSTLVSEHMVHVGPEHIKLALVSVCEAHMP